MGTEVRHRHRHFHLGIGGDTFRAHMPGCLKLDLLRRHQISRQQIRNERQSQRDELAMHRDNPGKQESVGEKAEEK